jgi:transcriptional regulator with XRE-family HTH domain
VVLWRAAILQNVSRWQQVNTFSKRAVGWVSPVLDGARRTGETACCDLAGDLAGDLAILSKQILCDSDFLKNMLKNANIVGQNVVIFRHQAGWTQDVLAAKIQLLGCYMTRDIIANIETRRSPVTDKRIAILAEVFGVAVGNLFPPTPSAFKDKLSLESRLMALFRIGRADKAMLELLRRTQAQAEAIVGTDGAEFQSG